MGNKNYTMQEQDKRTNFRMFKLNYKILVLIFCRKLSDGKIHVDALPERLKIYDKV